MSSDDCSSVEPVAERVVPAGQVERVGDGVGQQPADEGALQELVPVVDGRAPVVDEANR